MVKAKASALVLSFLFLLGLPSSNGAAADAWSAYDESAFVMSIPSHVKHTESRGPDFWMLDFSHQGRPWLSGYLGYAPAFPSKAPVSPICSTEDIQGMKVQVATRYYQKKTKVSREYLFTPIGEKAGRLSLHIWYDVLSGSELEAAEKAIHSIVLK